MKTKKRSGCRVRTRKRNVSSKIQNLYKVDLSSYITAAKQSEKYKGYILSDSIPGKPVYRKYLLHIENKIKCSELLSQAEYRYLKHSLKNQGIYFQSQIKRRSAIKGTCVYTTIARYDVMFEKREHIERLNDEVRASRSKKVCNKMVSKKKPRPIPPEPTSGPSMVEAKKDTKDTNEDIESIS